VAAGSQRWPVLEHALNHLETIDFLDAHRDQDLDGGHASRYIMTRCSTGHFNFAETGHYNFAPTEDVKAK
jgi:hypothetical protein